MFPSRTCTQREPKSGPERNYTPSDARYPPTRYFTERLGDYYARLRLFLEWAFEQYALPLHL